MSSNPQHTEELAFVTRTDVHTAIQNSGHNELFTSQAERDFFAGKIWKASKFNGHSHVISRAAAAKENPNAYRRRTLHPPFNTSAARAAAARRGGARLTDRVKGVDFARYGVAAVALGVAIVAGSEAGWAQSSNTNDLGGMARRISTVLSMFPDVVAVLAQLFGVFWALAAAMALKKAGAEDDCNPAEMKKSLFNLIAGVMAVGLPAAIGLGAHTFFGGTDKLISDPSQGIQIR